CRGRGWTFGFFPLPEIDQLVCAPLHHHCPPANYVTNSKPLASHSGGGSQCLEALMVALDLACDGEKWYTSTQQLQLASLDLCKACRGVPTLALSVKRSTPEYLWAEAARGPRGRLTGEKKPPAARTRTRVPSFGPRRVMWKLPAFELRLSPKELWANVQCLLFTGYHKDEVYDSFSWPTGLKRFDLGYRFFGSIERVAWPATLERLNLGPHFNQSVQNVVWPESLQEICFGVKFCYNLDAVKWPASMRRVYLTGHHQKPVWPGVQVIERRI
ncbi:unnamed protein product, partial [Ectocarpus sp. 4 AP-2014]